MRLIHIGRQELFMHDYKCVDTTLHNACLHETSTKFIMKLMDIGGREIIIEQYLSLRTALHCACLFVQKDLR
jgi:hypothetical protein